MDREKAIRILTLFREEWDRHSKTPNAKALDMAIEALKDPERKKGQWELIEEDWNVYRCSVCGEDWVLEASTPRENNMNFCPMCGAKMEDYEE